MMCQHQFVSCKKGTALVGGVRHGGGWACVGTEGTRSRPVVVIGIYVTTAVVSSTIPGLKFSVTWSNIILHFHIFL